MGDLVGGLVVGHDVFRVLAVFAPAPRVVGRPLIPLFFFRENKFCVVLAAEFHHFSSFSYTGIYTFHLFLAFLCDVLLFYFRCGMHGLQTRVPRERSL